MKKWWLRGEGLDGLCWEVSEDGVNTCIWNAGEAFLKSGVNTCSYSEIADGKDFVGGVNTRSYSDAFFCKWSFDGVNTCTYLEIADEQNLPKVLTPALIHIFLS